MESLNSKKQIDVSVIIPMYNAEDVLSRCLEDVVAQTLQDIEIICVDDGSTDATPAMLDLWAGKDNRIRVIHQPNGGAGAARNAGLSLARGEYLSFLDVDDLFRNTMLERAYRAACKSDLDIIVFRSDEHYPESNRYASIPWTIVERLLPPKMPFAGTEVAADIFNLFIGWAWDKLFKASFVRENGLKFQELRTTNDLLFTFSSVVKAQRIGVMHEVLIHHVKSEGSLSVTREKSWDCFYRALRALRDQLCAWNMYDRFERDFINYCVHAILWNVDTLAEPTKTLLLRKLASEWVAELGILGHERRYFYNKKEYERLLGLIG